MPDRQALPASEHPKAQIVTSIGDIRDARVVDPVVNRRAPPVALVIILLQTSSTGAQTPDRSAEEWCSDGKCDLKSDLTRQLGEAAELPRFGEQGIIDEFVEELERYEKIVEPSSKMLPTIVDTAIDVDGDTPRPPTNPAATVVKADIVTSIAPETLIQQYEDVLAIELAGGAICTGVVVHPRLVLTAAHCQGARRVYVGARIEALAPSFAVQSFERAPSGVDAGLVALETPIYFLPVRPRRRKPVPGSPPATLRIVGFGSNDRNGRGGVGVRRSARITTYAWGCSRGEQRRYGCRPDAELLIVGAFGADTCVGDSGGPVFEELEDGTQQLVAITSRGLDRRGRVRCGDGGVYVRVDHLADWLDARIERETRQARR